jgi:hypothetical protein
MASRAAALDPRTIDESEGRLAGKLAGGLVVWPGGVKNAEARAKFGSVDLDAAAPDLHPDWLQMLQS